MKCFRLLLFTFFLVVVSCDPTKYEDCLQKDSITCLQMQVFEDAKALLNKKSFDLFSGISIEQDPELESARKEKSTDFDVVGEQSLSTLEENVQNAIDVSDRQAAIGDYLVRKVRDVIVTKSIKWNVGESIKAISDAIPQDLKMRFNDLIVEGRGKKKKIMRLLMPILMAIKMKIAIVTLISFFGIALIAKKALIAGAISLAITSYIGIRKLMAQQQKNTYKAVPIHTSHVHDDWQGSLQPQVGAGYGYSSPGDYGHHDHMAYSGHKSP